MFTSTLPTARPDVTLIKPEIARDAPLSVQWLADPHGRETLHMMGVRHQDNTASTLPKEEARIRSFLEATDQLNWMIAVEGKVVGAIWVDLQATNELQAPAIHIMIGDPMQRGKGAGRAALQAVIDYVQSSSVQEIYSRYLVANSGARQLLGSCGFHPLGDVYADKDGLAWQNAILAES